MIDTSDRMDDRKDDRLGDRPWRRGLALVTLAAIGAHVTALGGGFVWLDHAHIEGGLGWAPPGRWSELFTRGFAGTGFYRPLMAASLSLDAALGGPVVFHATSLLWHAAAALCVATSAVAIGLERRAALLAGLLFAVHPAGSLVAGAVAFRSESMIAVCLLVLVAAHLRGRPVLAAVALATGALTKETALVLGPLFVGAIELGRRASGASHVPVSGAGAGPAGVRASPTWQLFAAEILALALVVGLRLLFAPAWRAQWAALALPDAVGTRLAALAKGIAVYLVPIDRNICDAFPVTPLLSVRALAGAAAVAAVGVLAWRRRGPALLMALALLPAANLVPTMRWWSPHYFHVAAAFAAMLAGEAALAAARGRRAAFAGAAVLGALALVSLRDGLRFRTDRSLWRPEVAARPECREGHFYLGEAARRQRSWDEAALHYRRALAPVPGFLAYSDRPAALQNLAAVELERKRWPEARAALGEAHALARDPVERRRIVHNLAVAAMAAGDVEAAWHWLEPEVAAMAAPVESLFMAARALHLLGRERESALLIDRIRIRIRAAPAGPRAGAAGYNLRP